MKRDKLFIDTGNGNSLKATLDDTLKGPVSVQIKLTHPMEIYILLRELESEIAERYNAGK